MKKKRAGVEIELVIPANTVEAVKERLGEITTRETQGAYLKRMAQAAKAMEKRYGK